VTTESGQASDQSSSSSSGQQQSQASAAQGAASDQGQSQAQSSAPQRPAYIPEKYWSAEKGEVLADNFTRDFNDLSAFKAEADVRKSTLPASPDKYEIKLPEGFKPPEGMAFEFNADDPALAQARTLAHQKGWSQQDFSEALGIFASTKVAELQQTNTAREAELAKLGTTGPQRIDAIETWLKAKVGDKAAIAISTLKSFPVAANVEMFESIIRAFSSQGGTTFDQRHREGGDDKGAIPGYEKMSFAQRRAAQMNQQYGGAASR